MHVSLFVDKVKNCSPIKNGWEVMLAMWLADGLLWALDGLGPRRHSAGQGLDPKVQKWPLGVGWAPFSFFKEKGNSKKMHFG